MTKQALFDAIGRIDDSFILAAADVMEEKSVAVFSRHRRKILRTVLIAAVIAALLAGMCITAYALNLFGFRALLRPEGTTLNGTESNELSITQPQDVPEEISPAIAEKVGNNETAWAEWESWRRESGMIYCPDLFSSPENSYGFDCLENPDGSYAVVFYGPSGATGESQIIKTCTATAEDYAMFEKYMGLTAQLGIQGYDFTYHVYTQESADKLEEIAAKYGLALRRERHSAICSEPTGQTAENFYTNVELAEMTAQIGCAGNIFYETPPGFDKVYWFDEGSFCISYYVVLPSNGRQVTCYGYNSKYSTLSSGMEVVNLESDLSAFIERTHTTPDGTEVTILSNGADAYIYVFLENSFFAEHISCTENVSMTDSDLNFIADYIQYSLIGK